MSDESLNKHGTDAENENLSAGYSSDSDSELQEDTFDFNSIYEIDNNSEAAKRDSKSRSDEIMREIRREAEMKAIREDIERRYALELETAQSKDMAESVPEIGAAEIFIGEAADDAPAQAEQPQNTEISKQPSKKHNKKSKQKRTHGNTYDVIYYFGEDIIRYLGVVFMLLFRLIATPVKGIYAYSEKATGYAARRARSYAKGFIIEMRHFRREIHSTSANLRNALRRPSSIPSILWYYFRKAYKRHRMMLRTLFNTAMPISALLIFALTINYWNGVTFALKVKYNQEDIGYISSESVYLEAQELIKQKMDTGAFAASLPDSTKAAVPTAAASPDFQAEYALTLVSLEELNDAQTICDRVIENSADNLTNACGVYVGGEFVCAVKNEADAKTVFNKIIEPYELDAAAKGYVVGFAENIEYVQGLYPDENTVMWDAARLETELASEREVNRDYTVQRGESLESISDDYSLTAQQLEELNPETRWESLRAGETITVRMMDKYIHIKKTVTTTTNETVKYDTETSRDATKYSGYRSVTRKGVDGVDKVTTVSVYIDDVLDEDLSTTKRDHIVAPVSEKIVIGTNTYYSGVYVGTQSSKGFLWPAPSCHSVSSPYGNRSSGWHKGIDLIKSGGGANGTPVIASRSGTVEVVQYSSSGYGNMVLINHGDGYKTRYAHMLNGSIRVSEGQRVTAGEQIGRVGSTGNSTGPHLHFEVIYNGNTQNPKNYIY